MILLPSPTPKNAKTTTTKIYTISKILPFFFLVLVFIISPVCDCMFKFSNNHYSCHNHSTWCSLSFLSLSIVCVCLCVCLHSGMHAFVCHSTSFSYCKVSSVVHLFEFKCPMKVSAKTMDTGFPTKHCMLSSDLHVHS